MVSHTLPRYARLGQLFHRLGRFGLRTENIVLLHDERVYARELLFAGRLPRTVFGWRLWYGSLTAVKLPENITVNVDSWHLHDPVIHHAIEVLCQRRAVRALEWTEHGRQRHMRRAAAILRHLRTMYGTEIWVDDLGSGQDGLQRIAMVQPNVVKLDGSMLHASRADTAIASLVREHVALLARRAMIVAEWIETTDDMLLARTLGAVCGQGWYFQAASDSGFTQPRGHAAVQTPPHEGAPVAVAGSGWLESDT